MTQHEFRLRIQWYRTFLNPSRGSPLRGDREEDGISSERGKGRLIGRPALARTSAYTSAFGSAYSRRG